MIAIGTHNTLSISREAPQGLYLADERGEEVLLPRKFVPARYKLRDAIEVFVYLDGEERKVATTQQPKITMGQFALLEVSEVTTLGAFLDWGMDKDLFVPFREQKRKMHAGESYVVRMDIDRKTNRLFATSKLEKWLQNENLTVAERDEVDLLVYEETELGYLVIVNGQHKGLVYDSDIYQPIHEGDRQKGYIRQIRPDHKLDVTLQPIGYTNYNDENANRIYRALVDNNGQLDLTDKSDPKAIYAAFGISKKAFKKAVGALYKDRKITIEKDGIKLIKG